MAEQQRNRHFRRARFERQKREAIQKEQTERCYKQYSPPQIRYCNDLVKP